MKEMIIMGGSGLLGYGITKECVDRGIERKPYFIGADAGSSDPGPAYLGDGKAFVSRSGCKHDLELLLVAARKAKIPLLIGTAGGAGGRKNLEWFMEIFYEIAREQNMHLKVATIDTEIDKEALKKKLAENKVESIGNLPELTEEVIDVSEHIVALAGPESYQEALRMGADVVICGRSSDTSVFSAIPLMEGYDPGPTWHAAKMLECTSGSAEPLMGGEPCIVTAAFAVSF